MYAKRYWHCVEPLLDVFIVKAWSELDRHWSEFVYCLNIWSALCLIWMLNCKD